MAEFFDWNPARGTWYETEEQDGKLLIHTKQDIRPVMDWIKKRRNSGMNDKGGLRDKDDLKHYATIPTHVELELRQKGINIYDKNDLPKVLYEIEHNYPDCKVTNRKMA